MSVSVTEGLMVLEDSKLIGLGTVTLKDFKRYASTMNYRTYCVVYPTTTIKDVEEIDVLALKGEEEKVAEAIAKKKFMSGFKIVDSEKFFQSMVK